MKKKEAIAFLRSLIHLIEKSDDAIFEDIFHDNTRYAKATSAPTKIVAKLKPKFRPEELSSLTSLLQRCETREEARDILRGDTRLLSKNNLNDLARFLKIYIKKDDLRDQIEEKIVEYVVGTKLRSQAILGLNLKGQ